MLKQSIVQVGGHSVIFSQNTNTHRRLAVVIIHVTLGGHVDIKDPRLMRWLTVSMDWTSYFTEKNMLVCLTRQRFDDVLFHLTNLPFLAVATVLRFA